jgi:para-nitrobenzyl esterase
LSKSAQLHKRARGRLTFFFQLFQKLKNMLQLVVLAILFCVARGDPIVVTNAGSVRGTVHASGVQAYLGIPFAQPPVGNLRFAPPQPVAAWTGVRDATQFGFACMQDPSALMGYYYGPQSEDCLTINVFVPPGNKTSLNVMTWIYGGKFTTGSSRFPQYNPESLALDGVVVVTFNYRVGPWGFFVSDELLQQDKRNVNMALQDQQLALQWVQANIAAFRGDPKKVTLFGESAGR